MATDFQIAKKSNLHNQVVPWTQRRKHSSRLQPRHNNMKFLKMEDQETILTADRQKWLIIYVESSIRSTAHFSLGLWILEDDGVKYSKYWKKKTVKQEFYTQHNYDP